MKRTGCLFIIIVVVLGLLWGGVASHIRNDFNDRRLEILGKCERVIPSLNLRYASLDSLLQIYESQAGWDRVTNAAGVQEVFTGNPNDLNIPWEAANSETLDVTVISPALVRSQDVHEGLAHFIHGKTAFEKCAGAIQIEGGLKLFWETLTSIPEFKTNALLIQLNSDLVATTPEAPSELSAILDGVTGYNKSLAGSQIGRFLQIPPINDYSFPHTWPHRVTQW